MFAMRTSYLFWYEFVHGKLTVKCVKYNVLWLLWRRTFWTKHYLCSAECDHGQRECGPGASRPCIPQSYVCDGDNDCGDNSDENADMCGQYKITLVHWLFSFTVAWNGHSLQLKGCVY